MTRISGERCGRRPARWAPSVPSEYKAANPATMAHACRGSAAQATTRAVRRGLPRVPQHSDHSEGGTALGAIPGVCLVMSFRSGGSRPELRWLLGRV